MSKRSATVCVHNLHPSIDGPVSDDCATECAGYYWMGADATDDAIMAVILDDFTAIIDPTSKARIYSPYLSCYTIVGESGYYTVSIDRPSA